MKPAILIVDDSLTVRMDLSEALESPGFTTILCSTLAEARNALSNGPFALVILDVLLPDGDGIELLREMRSNESTAKVPVMLLSSESEIRSRIRGLKTGADEYVGKPYDRSYVLARARELLRKQAPESGASRPSTVLLIDDSTTFREALKFALEAAGADAALRRTPCILLTASEKQSSEINAFDAGADDYIRKEGATGVILARLAAIIRHAGTPAAAIPASSMLDPKKILAVDDSLTYLEEIASQLRQDGYNVVPARSGEEALELLSVQTVDCILLDLVMPGLSGHETCRRIKGSSAWRDIPLIMHTAMEEQDAMIEGINAGADDYIAKSSDSEVLRARIRAQLRRKQFEDENRSIREQLLQKELEVVAANSARELAETRVVLTGELERKNKELETFSYSVSHDLRAPLRAIAGFSQVLVDDHRGKLDQEARELLDHIQTAARRMGCLIDDLLKLARTSRQALTSETVNLSVLAQEIALQLQGSEPRRQVLFTIAPNVVVDGDQGLLRVVLENLLGNAWKFTAKRENACIEFGAQRRVSQQVYFVRDNGAGFNMKYADKLFGPFQRFHYESDFPGTGIGLATVERIIHRHGGKIWAESEVGQGATFYFVLKAGNELRSSRDNQTGS